MIYLASNLKVLRKHNKVTCQHVADVIGIKRSSLSGYENGATEPYLATLLRISQYYRMSIDRLLQQDFHKLNAYRIGVLERIFGSEMNQNE